MNALHSGVLVVTWFVCECVYLWEPPPVSRENDEVTMHNVFFFFKCRTRTQG